MTGLIKYSIVLLFTLLCGKHIFLLGGLLALTIKSAKNLYCME